MDESAQPSKRALAGLESHKLNSLNGLVTLGAKPRNGHVAAQRVPVKRLQVIKAYAADCALPAQGASADDASAHDATASQIAQRFAPRQEHTPPGDDDRISASPLAPPLLALASGARTLAAALVAVALVPNLVLAALLWYGGIEPRWPSVTEPPPQQPEQSEQSQAPVIRSVVTTPILLMPPTRETIAADEATSALPREAVADLHETKQTGSLAASVPDEPLGPAATGIAHETPDLAAVDTEETRPDSSAGLPEPMPLPSRRPAPPTADAADASWVKATAYVNLRSAPSSGASVVAVVARGSKLRVVMRKRGGCRRPIPRPLIPVGFTAATWPPPAKRRRIGKKLLARLPGARRQQAARDNATTGLLWRRRHAILTIAKGRQREGCRGLERRVLSDRFGWDLRRLHR